MAEFRLKGLNIVLNCPFCNYLNVSKEIFYPRRNLYNLKTFTGPQYFIRKTFGLYDSPTKQFTISDCILLPSKVSISTNLSQTLSVAQNWIAVRVHVSVKSIKFECYNAQLFLVSNCLYSNNPSWHRFKHLLFWPPLQFTCNAKANNELNLIVSTPYERIW